MFDYKNLVKKESHYKLMKNKKIKIIIGVIKIEKLCFVNLNNSKERRNDVNINSNIAIIVIK
jgi:hypothetical protein